MMLVMFYFISIYQHLWQEVLGAKYLYKINLRPLILFILISLFIIDGCSKYSDEVQANLIKLKKTKSCSGCDLTGIELISFDLKGADLSGANLTGANLRRSDLTGANLTDTNLTDANLLGVNLKDAKLINTNLTGVKLSHSNINGAEISGQVLKDAHMNYAKVVSSKI